MKLIHDPSLLEQYLSGPPYTDYFEDGFRPYTQVMDYAAGESVLQQGVPSRYLFLMLRGRCCVRVALANGKTMILQTLKAPCLIGEMELLQEVSAFTVQALEKSRMLALPLIPCGAVLSRNVHFLRRICSDLILKERRGPSRPSTPSASRWRTAWQSLFWITARGTALPSKSPWPPRAWALPTAMWKR